MSPDNRPAEGERKSPVENKAQWRNTLLLNFLFFLYSLFSVFSKLGGQADRFSLPFFGWYGAAFLMLGLYAIGWQQVLKRMSLFRAYSGKAVVILWGILWGAVLFHEAVTPRKLIGAAVIMAGIILYSAAEGRREP